MEQEQSQDIVPLAPGGPSPSAGRSLVRVRAQLAVAVVHSLLVMVGCAVSIVAGIRRGKRSLAGRISTLGERLIALRAGPAPEVPAGLVGEYQAQCTEARGYIVRILVALQSTNGGSWRLRRELRALRRNAVGHLPRVYRLAQRCQNLESHLQAADLAEIQSNLLSIQSQINLPENDSMTAELLRQKLQMAEQEREMHQELVLRLPEFRAFLKSYVEQMALLAARVESLCQGPRGPRGGRRLRNSEPLVRPSRMREPAALPC